MSENGPLAVVSKAEAIEIFVLVQFTATRWMQDGMRQIENGNRSVERWWKGRRA